jgi:hypothetical protein
MVELKSEKKITVFFFFFTKAILDIKLLYIKIKKKVQELFAISGSIKGIS